MSNKPLDMNELAEWFGVSVPTVKRWVRDGVPCLRPSRGVVRFDLRDVTEWCKTQRDTVAPTPPA